MNIQMTWAEAMAMQRKHLDYYCESLTAAEAVILRRRIRAKTLTVDDPELIRDLEEINRLVPRGAAIEMEIADMQGCEWMDHGE